MTDQNSVFVSYAWGGESERTVDELERAFAECGIRIVRDKKDLDYKGSIDAFERRIGQGQCIILVISDKYLRSVHCMYELVEIEENRKLKERIFPIVLSDACIYTPIDRLNYIQHWDKQIKQLNRAIKQVGVMTNLTNIAADLDKYARIRANFDHLVDLLSDMNTLTPEKHRSDGFSILIDAVKSALANQQNTPQPKLEILKLLMEPTNSKLSLETIAKKLNLTEKTLQTHLDDLSKRGYVEIKPVRGHGSLISYFYEITPRGIDVLEKG